MIKYIATFKVPMNTVDAYTAKDVVNRIKRIEGVTAVQMYETINPPQIARLTDALKYSSHYCMEIEMEQDQPMVGQVLNGLYLENEDYVSDVQLRVYRQLA